jgi:CRISPR/Cas system CSM-associated protein Csm3 (group 7 of RAMP superfamily)
MRDHKHYRLVLQFETLGAIHPGSGETDGTSDADVTRDGFGQPILRGTAIAGSIRHELAESGSFTEPELRLLLGSVNDTDGPSLISVSDAPMTNYRFETREGVGIDRVMGSAAPNIKYDVSVLARGTRFTCVLRADGNEAHHTLIEEFFGTVHHRAHNGVLRFGGRTTRGFGALQLRAHEYAVVDDDVDFTTATRAVARNTWIPAVTIPAARPAHNETWRFTIDFTPVFSVFSKSARSSHTAIPETSRISANENDKVALLLAGSSLKGALRSHGEYIVRTKLGLDPVPGSTLNDQINVPGIVDVFGWATDTNTNDGRKAAVSVDDCYGLTHIASTTWRDVVRAAGESPDTTRGKVMKWPELRALLTSSGLPGWRSLMHNAINEFTGGVVDEFLFSTLVPIGERFEPVSIILDLSRITADLEGASIGADAALGLVLLILRDVRRGVVPFGFGSSKGFGHLKPGAAVTARRLTGDPTDDFAKEFDPFSDDAAQWRKPYSSALQAWFASRSTAPGQHESSKEVGAA